MILCLLLALAQSHSNSPGFPAYKRANELFVNKRMNEALAALEQALTKDERLVPALTLYAKIAMASNRYDLARNSLERALEADPKSADALFLYGFQFYLQNNLQDALPAFEKARQLNPKDSRATYYLGLTYESLGRLEEALPLYMAAGDAAAYVSGTRLLNSMGRLDEAAKWIQKALQLEPGSRDAHFEAARLLLRGEAFSKSAKEAERALALAGGSITDAQIHFLLIRAYRDTDPGKSAEHAAALRAITDR